MTNQSSRWTFAQCVVIFLSLLLYVVDGIDNQILPIAVPALIHAWGRPATEFRLAMSTGFIGIALGASAGGVLSDRFGRKPVMTGGALAFGIMTMTMALTSMPLELAAIRVPAGIGLGLCIPPVIAMLAECVRATQRSLVVSLVLIAPTIGVALSGVLGATLIPRVGWHGLFVLSGALALAMAAILLLFLPESPAWLARRGYADKARILVEKLDIEWPAAHIDNTGNIHAARKVPLRQLWILGIRMAVCAVILAFFLGYSSVALILGWLPTLLAQHGFPAALASLGVSAWSLTGGLGAILAGWRIGKAGVRKMGSIFSLLTIASALALAFVIPASNAKSSGESPWAMLLVMLLLALNGGALSAALASAYSFATETFPSGVLASGLGLVSMTGRIGSFFGVLAGASVIAIGGVSGFFIAVCALALLLCGCFFFSSGKNPLSSAGQPAVHHPQ